LLSGHLDFFESPMADNGCSIRLEGTYEYLMRDMAPPAGGSPETILRRRHSRGSKNIGALDARSHAESIDHFRRAGISARKKFLRICRGARRKANDGSRRN
jgi:hypothetical protein